MAFIKVKSPGLEKGPDHKSLSYTAVYNNKAETYVWQHGGLFLLCHLSKPGVNCINLLCTKNLSHVSG